MDKQRAVEARSHPPLGDLKDEETTVSLAEVAIGKTNREKNCIWRIVFIMHRAGG